MINNTCIYGTVDVPISTVKLKYIKYDFSMVLEKEYNNTTGAYQFNLGDADMLTLAVASTICDVCVISNETNGVIDYSDKVVLGIEHYYENNIVTGTLVVDSEVADAVDETTNIVGQLLRFVEDSESMYNYYTVEAGGEVVYETNDGIMEYIPVTTGEYVVTHRAVNKTTGIISDVVHTIDVLESANRVSSIDYVYYCKRSKKQMIKLADYITDTLILATGWYYENGLLIGSNDKLADLVMPYYNGNVIIKSYVGDIIDF